MTDPDLLASFPIASQPFDTVLQGGMVVDGTGADGFRADVGVRDGRVVAIGDLTGAKANRVLNCTSLTIAPGFIDIHTHSDISILYTPGMESSLAQGVTAEVVGNCGFCVGLATKDDRFTVEQNALATGGVRVSWNDLDGFLRRVEDSGMSCHIATLAGHGTLRKRVMGLAPRLPDESELLAMERELEHAMEAGAVGLSSGLEYVPGTYADVHELTRLARVAQQAGGFYATHLRDEGDTLEEAVQEALTVAENAGIALQLSHHKAEKRANWGKVERTLALVSEAQSRGVDVLLDQYPYTAYQTALATIALPFGVDAGSPTATAERLREPETRVRVRAQMPALDFAALELASVPHRRQWQGRTVASLVEEMGQDGRDVILDILSEATTFVSAAHFALSPQDVETVLRNKRVMVGSDAVVATGKPDSDGSRPHPRTFGTFARVLGRYVREQNVLSLPEAIRRMTRLPAQRLGWRDRGILQIGAWADICVFDPQRISDTATFAEPHALAVGVEYVFVNGSLAWHKGQPTQSRTGRVLRRAR